MQEKILRKKIFFCHIDRNSGQKDTKSYSPLYVDCAIKPSYFYFIQLFITKWFSL